MTSSQPPQEPQQPSGAGAPQPAPPAVYPGYVPPQPTGRSVSFYVAIFLALLLFISGGLNLLLLLFSALGSAAGGLGVGGGGVRDEDGGMYEFVQVGGSRRGTHEVLRLRIDGAIAEQGSPLIGAPGGTVSHVRRALRAATRDREVKAILLEVNSPGGGVTDSDEIYRLLKNYKQSHPDVVMVALFGDMAASGGYYVAMACDRVLARPTSITGSIGVIISQYNVAGALDKLHIEDVTIISPDTPYKDMLSPTRPMSPEEREKLLAIVQELYERFVDVVDEGRENLDRQAVKSAANGQIYSAQQALQNGLIDGIEDRDGALGVIAQMLDADRGEMRVIEQRRVPTFFDQMFSMRSAAPRASLDQSIAQLLRASTGPRMLYFWPGGR